MTQKEAKVSGVSERKVHPIDLSSELATFCKKGFISQSLVISCQEHATKLVMSDSLMEGEEDV